MPLTRLEPYMSNSSANFTFNSATFNSANLGPIQTVKITGGTNDQIMTTDGTGNLRFSDNIHPFIFIGI